MSVRLFILF